MQDPIPVGKDVTRQSRTNIRSRFISETTRLMRERGVHQVSTRQICDAVGVTAPSLYHHFGDLQGLQHSALEYAYNRFMESWREKSASPDPVTRIRNGWDAQIAFCRDEPTLYSIIATQNATGTMHEHIQAAHAKLVNDFREVQSQRNLRYPPETAAQVFSATCLGAATMLVLQGEFMPKIDGLSEIMREDVLANILGE
jgi:AcrR family transcriptional regulator